MRWNFEEQHGNEILLLYLVGGENVPACMPTGTTFSRTVKPSVNYAVPPSSRILVPGPHNEELGVPVASPAERKGETEMREKIKGTLGAIWCCCRPKSSLQDLGSPAGCQARAPVVGALSQNRWTNREPQSPGNINRSEASRKSSSQHQDPALSKCLQTPVLDDS
ncbi:uncharacterized protein [Pseudorca crassidens]|uniref:uncharacterized protein isoform X2 n=1 Tax=Pseudorca crassidens TaxID=82174 RepID=UPI00352E2B50